ncbi:hypothetical protein GCM10023238_15860 [Streptomyces heliomycini]
MRTAPSADADARLFAASTLRFSGDGEGRVGALHLVEVDSGRRAVPGTERVLPADLVLLALGFSGPDREDGLVARTGGGAVARGRSRGMRASRRTCRVCSPPGTPLGASR